jgi:hypothetical protein
LLPEPPTEEGFVTGALASLAEPEIPELGLGLLDGEGVGAGGVNFDISESSGSWSLPP